MEQRIWLLIIKVGWLFYDDTVFEIESKGNLSLKI